MIRGIALTAYSVDDDRISRWTPTTLRSQGKDEAYLERLIASDPLVLGLDPYVTGIGTSFAVFQQTWIDSPSARALRPDVVLLSETGHIVVVEVKLEDNPELRDRRVISQIIDYAAAVANLDDQSLASWLGGPEDSSWLDVVRRAFPKAHDVERLAAALADRISRADIHLVVACDVAPIGLRDTIQAISAQTALGGFQLHVVELTPYVNGCEPGRIIIVPHETARTEIISRTAVTVRREEGVGVGVTVVASSPTEVSEAMQQNKRGRSIRPEFEAIIDSYNLDAMEDLRASGRAAGYRGIKVPGWPSFIHYEFLDRGGEPAVAGAELHIETGDYPQLVEFLEDLASSLHADFPQLEYSSKWFKGCRLWLPAPMSDVEGAAQAMTSLIGATRLSMENALREVGMLGDNNDLASRQRRSTPSDCGGSDGVI